MLYKVVGGNEETNAKANFSLNIPSFKSLNPEEIAAEAIKQASGTDTITNQKTGEVIFSNKYMDIDKMIQSINTQTKNREITVYEKALNCAFDKAEVSGKVPYRDNMIKEALNVRIKEDETRKENLRAVIREEADKLLLLLQKADKEIKENRNYNKKIAVANYQGYEKVFGEQIIPLLQANVVKQDSLVKAVTELRESIMYNHPVEEPMIIRSVLDLFVKAEKISKLEAREIYDLAVVSNYSFSRNRGGTTSQKDFSRYSDPLYEGSEYAPYVNFGAATVDYDNVVYQGNNQNFKPDLNSEYTGAEEVGRENRENKVNGKKGSPRS